MNDPSLVLTFGGGGLLHAWDQHQARDRSTPSPGSSRPTRPGPERAPPAVPRTFDEVFTNAGQGVPVAYLRALAWHESRLDPRTASRTSSAVGLLQIVDVVRADHNRLHHSAYTRRDLLDPTINVTVGAAALNRIVRSYTRNHRNVPNLVGGWDNHRFAELVTLGWNAGWSERKGLGRVATHLATLGITDITIETIHQHALAADATRHLASAAKLSWSREVARLYAAERARDGATPSAAPSATPNVSADDASPVSSPSQVT